MRPYDSNSIFGNDGFHLIIFFVSRVCVDASVRCALSNRRVMRLFVFEGVVGGACRLV